MLSQRILVGPNVGPRRWVQVLFADLVGEILRELQSVVLEQPRLRRITRFRTTLPEPLETFELHLFRVTIGRRIHSFHVRLVDGLHIMVVRALGLEHRFPTLLGINGWAHQESEGCESGNSMLHGSVIFVSDAWPVDQGSVAG